MTMDWLNQPVYFLTTVCMCCKQYFAKHTEVELLVESYEYAIAR